MHAVMRALDLVGQRAGVRGRRDRVRHFEHGGDAAEHGAARAAFQVFLVRQAGLAEMHMRVHDAGQKVQPAAVDGLAGMAQRQIADGREAAAAYADIAQALAVLIDDGSTLENEVIGFGHGGPVGFKTGL